MTRPRPTTTQRHYGWQHQQARAKALRNLVPGTPCPFCGEPMFKDMRLDYDHHPPIALAGPGGERRLSHAACNRRAGQAIAQQLIRARKQQTNATQPRRINSQPW